MRFSQTLISPESFEKPTDFVLMNSSVLNETVVIALTKSGKSLAKQNGHDHIVYDGEEIEQLKGLLPDEIKILHQAKKDLPNSRLIDSKSYNKSKRKKWVF